MSSWETQRKFEGSRCEPLRKRARNNTTGMKDGIPPFFLCYRKIGKCRKVQLLLHKRLKD